MKIVLNPDFKTIKEFIEKIPDEFQKSGELIYQARNQLRKMQFGEDEIVIKSFRQPHLINRIAYTFFRKSKAQRSYEYSLRLLDNGVSTPEPVAYIEIKSNGLLTESYFINRYAENFSHIREQMYGNQIVTGFIPAFVKYVSDMHSKGILHKDLSPGNILFTKSKSGFEFCVLDINRMEFKKRLTFNECCKNFNRLAANEEVLSSIALSYSELNNTNKTETKRLMLKYSRKFFKNRKNI